MVYFFYFLFVCKDIVKYFYIFFFLNKWSYTAHRNRDRLYGFRKSYPMTYYMEGVVAIGLQIICITCFVLQDQNEDGHIDRAYVVVRGAGMLLFNLISLIMLLPIRTIGISPKYKNHFKRKGKKKYLRLFRWMCFINICNIIYSFLFISDEFVSILTTYKIEDTLAMKCAFTLSFSTIYFCIWCLSQLLPWIIPNKVESQILYTYNPGIQQESEISYMTQYAQVDKSRLGINTTANNDGSSNVSPPPSNLTDFDSSKYLLKSQNNNNNNNRNYNKGGGGGLSFDGDLSSLKVIDSPKSSSNNKNRPRLKERERDNINNDNPWIDDNDDGLSGIAIIEKYDDVIKMFKKEEDQDGNDNELLRDIDNDNVNQLDKVKSFANNYND